MMALMKSRGLTAKRLRPVVVGLLTYAITGMMMPDYPLPLGWRSVA